jgi:CRISPR-associated endonuclease/helicase Cas3
MSSSSKDRLVSHPHQSLLRHLQSVDEVSGRALEGKVLSSDLFDEVDANTLRKLLVYFHDFGKGHDFFQHRITEVARKENPEMEGLDGEYVRAFEHHPDRALLEEAKYDPLLKGHSTLGAFVVQTALPEDASPLLRVIIYEAIARHHGNLKNFDAGAERGVEGHEATLEGQWPRMNHADYRAILATTEFGYKQDLKAIQAAYPELFFGRVYRKLNRNEALKPYLQTVFLFSLLLAGDKGDMMLRERQMIGRVRRMQSRLIEQYKAHMFGAGAPSLMNKWREEAYQRVAQTLADHPDAGFYSITLPTGMGKTLTAYNAAVQLQNQMTDQLAVTNPNCTPRVIYCLPFTSVIDQNAAILEEILALDGVTGELAKHHYLADWPDKREESEGQLEYSEKEYLVEGWEYSLTVTTFVQLLETLVSNRNRKLRKFHNLANAIVILDEVQSIPPKYFNLVSDVLTAIHETMGTRFVFVTATQPFMMREQSAVIELTDPTKAYTKLAFERMNRIDLDLSLWVDGPDDLNEQAEVFADAARNEDRSFLIILNLVAQSREVFLRLADEALPEVDYIYLSSAVLPIERKRRIAQIQAKDDGRRKVVVSTQVVEAGVDIDLDVVYRAFAPLDSINQSAGRCNRSMRAGFRGSVRLFRSEKAAKIYDKTLLKKTERVLKKQQKEARLAAEYRENILPEACFYAMNEKYAGEVRRAVADENAVSAEILDDLKKLRFEDAERKFKLIDKAYTTYGVFIDAPEELPKVTHRNPVSGEDEELTCTEVYQRMLHILHDDDLGRWEKKQELRLLRPALLQYVVQFPEYAMPAHLQQEAEGKPFIRLTAKDGDHDYRQCYDIVTGYFKPEDKPTQSF